MTDNYHAVNNHKIQLQRMNVECQKMVFHTGSPQIDQCDEDAYVSVPTSQTDRRYKYDYKRSPTKNATNVNLMHSSCPKSKPFEGSLPSFNHGGVGLLPSTNRHKTTRSRMDLDEDGNSEDHHVSPVTKKIRLTTRIHGNERESPSLSKSTNKLTDYSRGAMRSSKSSPGMVTNPSPHQEFRKSLPESPMKFMKSAPTPSVESKRVSEFDLHDNSRLDLRAPGIQTSSFRENMYNHQTSSPSLLPNIPYTGLLPVNSMNAQNRSNIGLNQDPGDAPSSSQKWRDSHMDVYKSEQKPGRPLHACIDSNHTRPPDSSGVYVPGMELLMDESEVTPIDLISRFGQTPDSSPTELNDDCIGSVTLPDVQSSGQLLNNLNSNVAQRPISSAHTSPVSANSGALDANKIEKERYAQLRLMRESMQADERRPLPALHLHLSKDGSSPLPPGWQRARSVKQSTDTVVSEDDEEQTAASLYAYYYYHVRTRQTRWDPPVYPWDADPTDTLTGETGEEDPEAPYNWGCASKYCVTHDEIDSMYSRLRQRILERQCTELLHEMAGKSESPQGPAEQSFAIELFTLVHNVLRTFRDARCKLGRIINDEDLYYLTKKLAQAVIVKEVQKLHLAQAATSSSLFSSAPAPELTPPVQARVTTYVRKYMESKGPFYRRRVPQAPIPPVQSQPLNNRLQQLSHLPHARPDPTSRTAAPNPSASHGRNNNVHQSQNRRVAAPAAGQVPQHQIPRSHLHVQQQHVTSRHRQP